jgi:hypothetical protein
MRSAPALLLALLLSACAAPGRQAAPPAEPASISPARLAEHVRTLSSDDFEGRGPGTAGETKTVAYLSEQFAAVGLQPGGRNGSWTQDVPLVQSDIVGQPNAAFSVGGRRRR